MVCMRLERMRAVAALIFSRRRSRAPASTATDTSLLGVLRRSHAALRHAEQLSRSAADAFAEEADHVADAIEKISWRVRFGALQSVQVWADKVNPLEHFKHSVWLFIWLKGRKYVVAVSSCRTAVCYRYARCHYVCNCSYGLRPTADWLQKNLASYRFKHSIAVVRLS